jgi:hypothetical protein
MTKYNHLLYLILFVFIYTGCDAPKDLIDPTHNTRVPRPLNLTATIDTAALPRDTTVIRLQWIVNDTTNLKDFEVYRRISNNIFSMLTVQRELALTDKISWVNITDSVQFVGYAVVPIGIDRYRGQSSDSLYMYIAKKK